MTIGSLIFALALLLVFGFILSPVQGQAPDEGAQSVQYKVFKAVADVTIAADDGNTNFNGPDLAAEYWFENHVHGYQYSRGFLVKFDLAGLAPGAIIDSAELRLSWSSCPPSEDGAAYVAAHFVKSAWSERTVTWNSRPWWESMGVGRPLTCWNPNPAQWEIGSFARAWQSNPATNYGVYAAGPFTGDYSFRFNSRETGAGPLLVVAYHLVEPTATPTRTRTPRPPTATPTATLTHTPSPHTATPTLPATSTPTRRPSSTPTPSPTCTLSPVLECRDYVLNGDFESDDLWPWNTDGPTGLGSGFNGSQGAWLGGSVSSHAELFCSPNVPPVLSPLTLRFRWRAESDEAQQGDHLIVFLEVDGVGYGLLTLPAAEPLGHWQQLEIDLTPFDGGSLSLIFAAQNDDAVPTTYRLDDVELLGCGHFLNLPLVIKDPPVILRDDFNDGDLVGWSFTRGNWTNPGDHLRGEFLNGPAWAICEVTAADFGFEATINVHSGLSAGLTFRSTPDGVSSYDVILDVRDGLFLLTRRNPDFTLDTYSFDGELNTDYRIRVEAVGDSIVAFLDGAEIMAATDDSYSTGHLGLALTRATTTFDDVVAWSLD